jgi:preprotein translocase subunit SecG
MLNTGGINMEIALLIISVLLIIIVLLQSGKAEAAGQIIQGGNSDLFANRKERGLELFISRLTMLLGVAYFVLSLFISLR